MATVTPDTFFPSTACYVQAKLGAANAVCFDLSAACSGFLYALGTVCDLFKPGECPRYIALAGYLAEGLFQLSV